MLAHDTYLILKGHELQRLEATGRTTGQVAMSQLFYQTELGLDPLIQAEGAAGVSEATYLYRMIEESLGTKAARVKLINDVRLKVKEQMKGGGGVSEGNTSCMSETSANLCRGAEPPQPKVGGPARMLSSSDMTASSGDLEALGQDERKQVEEGNDKSNQPSDTLTASSANTTAGRKRRRVVIDEDEEEEGGGEEEGKELKQLLEALKGPQAVFKSAEVPLLLQSLGQIFGKDRERVVETLARSSSAVWAELWRGGALSGFTFWLHHQIDSVTVSGQGWRMQQQHYGGAEGIFSRGGMGKETGLFMRMLRLVHSLLHIVADGGRSVDVREWQDSQAAAVLADVKERFAPHVRVDAGHATGRIEGKCTAESRRGVWPQEARQAARDIVDTACKVLAAPRAAPSLRRSQYSHSILLTAQVSQAEGGSEAGGAIATGARAALLKKPGSDRRRNLRVSFRNYMELEEFFEFETYNEATLDVQAANGDLGTAQNCLGF